MQFRDQFVTSFVREGAVVHSDSLVMLRIELHAPMKVLPRPKAIVCILSLHTNSRICTQLATRVRYTTVNLRPTASACDFLPQALLRGLLPRRRLRLRLLFLYSRRVYVILRGISTLMYRVRQATVLYVWPSEAPIT